MRRISSSVFSLAFLLSHATHAAVASADSWCAVVEPSGSIYRICQRHALGPRTGQPQAHALCDGIECECSGCGVPDPSDDSDDLVAIDAPVTVTNPSVVTVSSNETRASYHAELSANKPCVHVQLPIKTEALYLLRLQHSQSDISVSIPDVNGENVAMAKCLTGCERAAVTSRRLADATATRSLQGHSESWAGPISVSLAISLTSLIGVFVLGFDKGRAESIVEFATSFAAGCLMGVVVFRMWPEGLEYLEDAGDWMSGMYVLMGVAFSMAVEQGIHMVLESFGGAPCDHNHTHEHHPHHDHSTMDSHSPRTKLSPRSSSPEGHTHASHHLPNDSHYMAHPLTPLDQDRATAANQMMRPFHKYVSSLKVVESVAWITAMGDFFHAFVDGVGWPSALKAAVLPLGGPWRSESCYTKSPTGSAIFSSSSRQGCSYLKRC